MLFLLGMHWTLGIDKTAVMCSIEIISPRHVNHLIDTSCMCLFQQRHHLFSNFACIPWLYNLWVNSSKTGFSQVWATCCYHLSNYFAELKCDQLFALQSDYRNNSPNSRVTIMKGSRYAFFYHPNHVILIMFVGCAAFTTTPATTKTTPTKTTTTKTT